MKRSVSALAVAAVALAVGGSAIAAPERVKSGMLSCDISAGLGLIIGSNKQVTCVYAPAAGGAREVYVGSISKFGIDIGATAGGRMEWAVYAPTDRRFGALAGHYTGATAEATVGVGAGANVLIGGSDRTISLQPLSLEGQTGLNVAAGVADLELHPAR